MVDTDAEPYSYDEVPYRSWPYPQSQPDRLATIGTIFGVTPQPVDQARVLELGCAAGGNLLPLAESYSESEFVGVDLSIRELDEAIATAQRLGLRNVEFLHKSIAEVGEELGPFDYIIIHGVFSWVAREVQEKIFQICRSNLAPNGIAYISYNTYPGWHMRGMIRDMVCYHTEGLADPTACVAQARALVKFLTQSVASQNNAYGAYLREELELFGQVDDYYLYHDHLEKVNEPVYFRHFVQRAKAHGLQFLGEADFSTMLARNLSPQVEATLQRITRDIVQMEQYMDFVRNRTFRQTLLCHADVRLERALKPERLDGLFVASSLRTTDANLDVTGPESVRFEGPKVKLETADRLAKAALVHLAEHWPGWVPFRSLVLAARTKLHPGPIQDAVSVARDAQHLGEQLLRCYASGAIELHATPPPFVLEVTERPQAASLARLQAESGSVVTNRRGETVTLTDLSRHCLACLDGTADRNRIADRLVDLAQRGKLVIHSAGQPLSDSAAIRKLVGETLEEGLQGLARSALLIA